jgi:hypothetical protein
MNEFIEVDELVDQVLGNTNFLTKILFPRLTLIVLGIVSVIFLVSSI